MIHRQTISSIIHGPGGPYISLCMVGGGPFHGGTKSVMTG